MNKQMDVIVVNAFATKKGGLVVNYLMSDVVTSPKFHGHNELTCFYEDKAKLELLTPEVFEQTCVADYDYVDSFGGTARKQITRIYCPNEDGELKAIDLI